MSRPQWKSQTGPTGPARRYCPVPDCAHECQPQHLMCPAHWRSVPRHIRLAVWHAYDRGPGSPAHLRACSAAIRAARFKEVS